MSFITNVAREAARDSNFRRVLFTGEKTQLVIMHIPVGEEVGAEVHHHVEQVLYFLSGVGESVLNGERRKVGAGDVAVVTPGTLHNFVNTGKEPLEVMTVYSPANHIDGRVHATKEEAEKDLEDEEFGEKK